MTLPFEQPLNFLDPPSIDRVQLFKNLVKERYVISKNINTSYNEIGDMSVLERKYILEFLIEEDQKLKENIAKAEQAHSKKHQ